MDALGRSFVRMRLPLSSFCYCVVPAQHFIIIILKNIYILPHTWQLVDRICSGQFVVMSIIGSDQPVHSLSPVDLLGGRTPHPRQVLFLPTWHYCSWWHARLILATSFNRGSPWDGKKHSNLEAVREVVVVSHSAAVQLSNSPRARETN